VTAPPVNEPTESTPPQTMFAGLFGNEKTENQ
jgi:hypothetical protein